MIECPNNKALLWIAKNWVRIRFARGHFYNSLKITEHLWGFTRETLPQLIERAGYEVVDCRDYSVGDGQYQPDTVAWYPTWGRAVLDAIRSGASYPLLYAAVRAFDQLSSRLLGGGSCLALVARRSR